MVFSKNKLNSKILKVTHAETHIVIPTIKVQASLILESLEGIQSKCDKFKSDPVIGAFIQKNFSELLKKLSTNLSTQIGNTVNIPHQLVALTPAQASENYFNQVQNNISDYLPQIREIVERLNNKNIDRTELSGCLTKLDSLAGTFTRFDYKIFLMNINLIPSLWDVQNKKPIIPRDVEQEFNFIISNFHMDLAHLKDFAESIQWNVKEWRTRSLELEKTILEEEQKAKLSRNESWRLVLGIVLAISVIVLSLPASDYYKQKQMELSLDSCKSDLDIQIKKQQIIPLRHPPLVIPKVGP